MAVKAYFNAQGCRNKGGFKLMNRMNRKKAAPMFQFAFVAVLFQFRARKPQLSPLLQFPNRRQTPQVTPSLSPYILLFIIYAASKLRYLPGECFAPPVPPYTATPTGGKRRSAAPTVQYAFVAALLQYRARKPQSSPSSQAPNRRQTPVKDDCV